MELIEIFEAVRQFHDAFKIKNADNIEASLSEPEQNLRFELLREENEEYLKAAREENIVEIADALGDILYIWAGTVLKHGLQDKMAHVFREIQKSNMSKLGVNGQPVYRADGKVLKGENYFKPDIKKILLSEKM